jgi:MFS family permease
LADSKQDQTPHAAESAAQPARAGLVLISLIAVAAVANLNLSVANVALPSIGRAFDSSQTTLDLIAVGYSLGLAASVLYLGALGDRYGRKLMLILGMALSVPACLLAAYAPTDIVLFAARVLGGISAGMAYPTTLALIAALWSGPGRTKSIALWSAIGGGIAALGPLVAGALLEKFWWGSVFLITLPLAGIALLLAVIFVPSHVNETTDPVDNLGGVLSAVMVGTLILAINFAPVPNKGTLALGLAAIAVAAAVVFVIRQRRATNPLYDLHVAGRRIFWVAACAGIIVFGSLMGSAFVSQQYLQNVNGYSTLEAGAAFLPAVVFMVLVAPRSAKLVETRGARFTLLAGYVSLFIAFAWMLLFWSEGSPTGRWGWPTCLSGLVWVLPAHRRPTPSRDRSRCSAPGWPPARPICSVTSAVRSCSRSSVRCSRRDTPPQSRQRLRHRQTLTRSRLAFRVSSPSRSRALQLSLSGTRSTQRRSSKGRSHHSWPVPIGRTPQGSSQSSSARRSCSSCSPRGSRSWPWQPVMD